MGDRRQRPAKEKKMNKILHVDLVFLPVKAGSGYLTAQSLVYFVRRGRPARLREYKPREASTYRVIRALGRRNDGTFVCYATGWSWYSDLFREEVLNGRSKTADN